MKYLILDNIRSAYNVGAIFRTADAAGVSEILLCGYTPTPKDRFGRIQEEINKTSLGASKTVVWSHYKNTTDAVKEVQGKGVVVVAIEQTKGSKSLINFSETDSVAYVFGNEVDGVSPEVLSEVDTIVEIPMLGEKESLNVSVSVGVVLYHGIASKKF